jgi:hypothetical protein
MANIPTPNSQDALLDMQLIGIERVISNMGQACICSTWLVAMALASWIQGNSVSFT